MKINKKIIVLLLTITVNLIIGSDDIAAQIDKITANEDSPEAKLKSFEELRTELKLKPNKDKAIERKLEAAELIPISDVALKKALSPATDIEFLEDGFTRQRIKNELRITQLYLIQEKVRSTFGSNLDDITIDKIKDLLKNKWKDDLGLAEVFDEYKDVVKEEIIKNIKVSKYTKELTSKISSVAKAAVITDKAVVLAKKSVATSDKSDKAAGIIQKAVRKMRKRATEKLISESPETELIAPVKKAILQGGILSEEENAILKKYFSKNKNVTQEAFVKDLQLAEVANYKKIEDKMASISDLNDPRQEVLLKKLKNIAKKSKLIYFTTEDNQFLVEIGFDNDFLVENSLASFKKVYNDKIESLYREAGLSIPNKDRNTKLLEIDETISALKRIQKFKKFKIESQKFAEKFADISNTNFNVKASEDKFKKLKAITKDSSKANLKEIGLDDYFVDSLTPAELDSFKTLGVELYNKKITELHTNVGLTPKKTLRQRFFMPEKPAMQFDKKSLKIAQQEALIKKAATEAQALKVKVVAEVAFKKPITTPKTPVNSPAVTKPPVNSPAVTKPPVNNPAATGPRPVRTYNTIKIKT